MSSVEVNAPILHIGFPKAASSFLKRDFFAGAGNNVVIPRGRNLELFRKIGGGSDVQRFVGEHVTQTDQPIIVTNENLSGRTFWTTEGSAEVRENWHAAFPDSKIVIIVREQRDYVLSAYKYEVYTGHYMPRIDRFLEDNLEMLIEKLRYDQIISAYQNTFGEGNVCVLPVEWLRTDESKFYSELSRFTGLQRTSGVRSKVDNKSPKNWNYIEFIRKANFVLRFVASGERALRRTWQSNRLDGGAHRIVLYRGIVDPLSRAFESRPFTGELFSKDVEQVLSESNLASAELTGIPLRDFGYL